MRVHALLAAAIVAAVFAAGAAGRTRIAACTPGVKTSGGVTYRTFCGPARATVKVAGKTFTFTGGTCQVSAGIFTVNIGTISLGATKPKYLYFGMNVTPPKAGTHTALVAVSVPGKHYSLLHATAKVKAGLHGGTFSGSVLTGGEASGTFSC